MGGGRRTSTPPCVSPTDPWRRSPMSPSGSPRFPKETLDVAGGRPHRTAGQLPAGHRVVGQGKESRRRRSPGRTRASARNSSASSTPSAPARPCRSRWSPSWRRRAQRSRSGTSLASAPAGDAVSRPGLGWYIRRLRRMSLTEVVYRAVDAGRRRAWARRQVRPGATPAAAAGAAGRARVRLAAAASARARVSTRGRMPRWSRPPTRSWPGTWTVFGVRRAPTAPTRTGSYDPLTGRRAPDRELAFRIHHRDEAEPGNIKQVWEMSRHHHITVLAAAWWLTQDERYAEAAARPAPLLVAGKPVPDRRALDERHRGRRPADLLGVDPPAARRVAEGGRPVRAQPGRAPADRLASGVPGRLPQPRLVGQQPRRWPRRRAGWRRRARFPGTPRRPSGGGARPPCWSASSPRTPSTMG